MELDSVYNVMMETILMEMDVAKIAKFKALTHVLEDLLTVKTIVHFINLIRYK